MASEGWRSATRPDQLCGAGGIRRLQVEWVVASSADASGHPLSTVFRSHRARRQTREFLGTPDLDLRRHLRTFRMGRPGSRLAMRCAVCVRRAGPSSDIVGSCSPSLCAKLLLQSASRVQCHASARLVVQGQVAPAFLAASSTAYRVPCLRFAARGELGEREDICSLESRPRPHFLQYLDSRSHL